MAAQKRSSAGPNLRTFNIVLGLVAVAGLVALGYATLGGGKPTTELVELQGIEGAQQLYERTRAERLGDDAAPVKVVEFGDYQCPACATFAMRIKPLLKERYIDSGKVQLVYYDFPLAEIHKHAVLASRAAWCAGDQGRYWDYHDLLYARQSSWAYAKRAPVGAFTDYAKELGLDAGAFEACLNGDAHADVVTANRLLGEQLGVNGTPTVIIDSRRVPNDLEAIIQTIEARLAASGAGE